jgi:hypothetical protein
MPHRRSCYSRWTPPCHRRQKICGAPEGRRLAGDGSAGSAGLSSFHSPSGSRGWCRWCPWLCDRHAASGRALEAHALRVSADQAGPGAASPTQRRPMRRTTSPRLDHRPGSRRRKWRTEAWHADTAPKGGGARSSAHAPARWFGTGRDGTRRASAPCASLCPAPRRPPRHPVFSRKLLDAESAAPLASRGNAARLVSRLWAPTLHRPAPPVHTWKLGPPPRRRVYFFSGDGGGRRITARGGAGGPHQGGPGASAARIR